jgi:cell division protein FtsB
MKIGRFLLIPLFLIMLPIIFGDKGLIDYHKLKGKLASLKEDSNRIISENNALKEEIILLRSDLRYIENVARKELGMVKKKDIVYQFVE